MGGVNMFRGVFLIACLLLSIYSACGEVCLSRRLPNNAHGIDGILCFIDQKTLVIREFDYDGRGPDTFLYYYDTDSGYTASNIPGNGGGTIIPHPETLGRFRVGERLSNAVLEFSLPEGEFACDMAVFTIWCRGASTHFTRINIPQDIFSTVPEEGKILCNRQGTGGGFTVPNFDNCEQLHPSLTLEWTLNRTSETATFQLCGCLSSDRDEENIWMGFGLSGRDDQTLMFGADASIVWVDEEDGAQAEDYFLSAYAQCRNGIGACPDTLDSSGACSNGVTVLFGFRGDGQQCVIFSRNFTAGDQCDLELDPDREDQYIVWGVGGLGSTAFRHFINADSSSDPLHLGRDGQMNCGQLQCSSCPAYQNQILTAASNATFVAHIGPSGDQRGYMAITGMPGWGIAWYINGTLIPELTVVRDQTYTFVVNGGDDSNNTAQYHPLYITSSVSGGRALNSPEERESEVVYAGLDGETPLGVGVLCEYTSNDESDAVEDDCDSQLREYEAALTAPNCVQLASATNSFTWTPDSDTPDIVYYQCLTHQNLGWKIRVVDSIDTVTDSVATLSHPYLLSLLLLILMTLLLY